MVEILEIFAEAQERYYPFNLELQVPQQYRKRDWKLGFSERENRSWNIAGLMPNWEPKYATREERLAARRKRERDRYRAKKGSQQAGILATKRKRVRVTKIKTKKTLPASWEQIGE